MIEFGSEGSFSNTESFLKKMTAQNTSVILHKYGRQGVAALSAATPAESGQTASSWDYKIMKTGDNYSITWTNSHVENGFPVAVMLQYGHGTGTGGYVQGRDYINPALQPIFDKIAADVWKEVKSA